MKYKAILIGLLAPFFFIESGHAVKNLIGTRPQPSAVNEALLGLKATSVDLVFANHEDMTRPVVKVKI